MLPHDFFFSDRGPEFGTRTQLPIVPGHALTIHKCQGITLERAKVDVSGCWEAGLGPESSAS